MIRINDYFLEVIEPRMLQQYRDAPNFSAIVRAGCVQSDAEETVLWAVIASRDVDQAIGESLDMIGSVLGLTRDGRSDGDFRDFIKATPSRRSEGTPEDLIRFAKDVLGAATVAYTPKYPAGCALLADITLDQGVLNTIAPAGVMVANGTRMVDTQGNPLVDTNGNRIYCIS